MNKSKRTTLVILLILIALFFLGSLLYFQKRLDIPFLKITLPLFKDKSISEETPRKGRDYTPHGVDIPEAIPKKREEDEKKPYVDLELKRRKFLFFELSKTEYKVSRDAMAHDPSVGKEHKKYIMKWNATYREAVRLKYNIDKPRMESIYKEGIINFWPTYQGFVPRPPG